MHAAKPITENRKVLHELVPLNSLSPERFSDLQERIIIEEVKAGRYLFRKGDRDNQTIFLLEGTVNLIDGFRKVAGEIQSGTELSRYPISNLQPRQFAARAVNRSVIARIDSSLLDVFLTWDPSSAAEVVDIGAADNTDWMTRMLQSEAFVRLPPSKLQALLLKSPTRSKKARTAASSRISKEKASVSPPISLRAARAIISIPFMKGAVRSPAGKDRETLSARLRNCPAVILSGRNHWYPRPGAMPLSPC